MRLKFKEPSTNSNEIQGINMSEISFRIHFTSVINILFLPWNGSVAERRAHQHQNATYLNSDLLGWLCEENQWGTEPCHPMNWRRQAHLKICQWLTGAWPGAMHCALEKTVAAVERIWSWEAINHRVNSF